MSFISDSKSKPSLKQRVTPIFLIGAQKSGTSYLYNLLRQDTAIISSLKKELHFFSKPVFDQLKFPLDYQIDSKYKFTLDASTSYLHVSGTAERIYREVGGDVPIIAVLRDPVERAISGYKHELKHGRELRFPHEVFDFDATDLKGIITSEREHLERAYQVGLVQPHNTVENRYRDPFFQFSYVANSVYSGQFETWLSNFKNIFLIDFSDLISEPIKTVNRLRQHLGIEKLSTIEINVPRNTTRVGLFRTFKNNRKLDYDNMRPSTLFVGQRLWEIRREVDKAKSILPQALADYLRLEFQSFKLKTKSLWI